MKRKSLSKWRNRYSKSEYPERMAANVMGSSILKATLSSRVSRYFRTSTNSSLNLEGALSKVDNDSSSLNRDIARRVDDRINGRRNDLGEKSSDIDYEKLMSEARRGQNGDNQSIEKIEYNWVYNALSVDLIELWFACGLAGMSKSTAFNELFHFVELSTNLDNPTEINAVFGELSGAILSAPGAYRKMPALW